MNTASPAPVAWLTVADGGHVGYQVDIEILRDQCFRKGLTGSELARRTEKSRGYIHDIMNGRRQPSVETLHVIAGVLDIHPRALLLRALTANSDAPVRDAAEAS